MANLAIDVSKGMKREMDKCSIQNWNILIEREIRKKIEILKSNRSLQKP
jgi:hypothetical protein